MAPERTTQAEIQLEDDKVSLHLQQTLVPRRSHIVLVMFFEQLWTVSSDKSLAAPSLLRLHHMSDYIFNQIELQLLIELRDLNSLKKP